MRREIDLKVFWTQEELLDLIAEAELLRIDNSDAAPCRICSEPAPILIRFIMNGFTTGCPGCAMEFSETDQHLEQEQLRNGFDW